MTGMDEAAAIKPLESLLGIFAARADLRGSVGDHGPATLWAGDDRLSQHAANQGAAPPAAAGAGADAGASAHLLERFRAGLNRFHHSAFANFVAKACRFEILDDRLLSSFLF